MDEHETRFKSLIQPIRDLSLNWDIDIAEELGDYLEELDKLQITINNGQSNLNFAEAALLIQGSAAVYSKKVEYLHQLVLNALELITSQKYSKSATAGGVNGNQNIKGKLSNHSFLDDERILFGSDPDLLLLDDVLEEGLNIVLPNSLSNSSLKTSTGSKLMRRNSLSGDLSKSSMILMHSIFHEDHGSTNLRLSSCRMDRNGALVIGSEIIPQISDISIIAKYDNSVFFEDVDTTVPLHDTNGEIRDDIIPINDHDDGDLENGYVHSTDHFDNPQSENDYNGLKEDSLLNAPHALEQHGQLDHPVEIHRIEEDYEERHVTVPLSKSGHERIFSDQFSEQHPSENQLLSSSWPMITGPKKALIIPLLDPHEISTGSKPVKKGRTFKLPATLLNSNEPKKPPLKPAHSSTEYLTDSFLSRDAMEALAAGVVPLTGLFNPELQHIAKMTKKKQRTERFRQQLARVALEEQYLYHHPMEENFGPDHVEPAAEIADAMMDDNMQYWCNDENDGGDYGGEYADTANNNHFGGDGPSSGAHEGQSEDNQDIMIVGAINENGEYDNPSYQLGFNKPSTYINPFATIIDEELELARRVEEALNDSARHQNSYEILCRRHIQEFMQGAELYARETQLSRRVNEWTRRLDPVLRQQEESATFDIHVYADNVLAKVAEASSQPIGQRYRYSSYSNVDTIHGIQEQSFGECVSEDLEESKLVGIEELAGGMSAAEVSRTFLACLQLANYGNLAIISRKDRPTLRNNSSGDRHDSHGNSEGESLKVGGLAGHDRLDYFRVQLLNGTRAPGVHMVLDSTAINSVFSSSGGHAIHNGKERNVAGSKRSKGGHNKIQIAVS